LDRAGDNPQESWPDSKGERCVRRKRTQKPGEEAIGKKFPGKAVQEPGGGWTSVCSLNTDSLSSAGRALGFRLSARLKAESAVLS